MESNFTKLGYTIKWMEFGILGEEELKKQLLEFKQGEDTNKEHYRYRTLCNWIDKEDIISINKLNGIIEILKNDSDKAMSTAAYFRLYSKSTLLIEQKELLEMNWTDTNEQLKVLIDTEKLESKIQLGDISNELFEDCIQRKKTGLLRMVIEHTESKMYLERLLTFEHSKKIRNIAKARIIRLKQNKTK